MTGLQLRWRLLRDRPDAGASGSIEAAQLAPIVALVLMVIIVGGRVSNATDAADQAARAAARSASIDRALPAVVSTNAANAARESFTAQGVSCGNVTVDVDTTGLGSAVGSAAAVTATVRCTIQLSELAFPGLPGDRELTASFTSLVDPNRERAS